MKKGWIISGMILAVATAAAQNPLIHTHNGNKLYKEGKYDLALPEYQKSLVENSQDPVTNYNLGNAYFRNGKFAEAANIYNGPEAKENASDLRQQAFYNHGVALSRQNKLEESIEAYKNAVRLNPADEDARVNLQKALLELRKKQQQENQKQDQEKKNNEKQKQNKQEPPPQSKLTKKQAEQLLKALQQREQQVQQKMQQNRSRSTTKPEKDW